MKESEKQPRAIPLGAETACPAPPRALFSFRADRSACFEYKTNVFDTVAGRCYRSSHAHQNMLMLAKGEGTESLELSRFFVPEASATLAGGLFAFRPVTGLRQVTGRGGQK